VRVPWLGGGLRQGSTKVTDAIHRLKKQQENPVKPNRVKLAVFLLAVTATTPMPAQNGAAIYKSKCQMCHMADGSGNKAMKVPAFSPGASEASLIAITKKGKASMAHCWEATATPSSSAAG
jgi:mono/diheme cytochrome c family protein